MVLKVFWDVNNQDLLPMNQEWGYTASNTRDRSYDINLKTQAVGDIQPCEISKLGLHQLDSFRTIMLHGKEPYCWPNPLAEVGPEMVHPEIGKLGWRKDDKRNQPQATISNYKQP